MEIKRERIIITKNKILIPALEIRIKEMVYLNEEFIDTKTRHFGQI